MEKNLTLLGATGIEDKLQDHVIETLDLVQKAGITTWMLTGDKKETALNMAHASGIVKTGLRQIDLCEVLDKKSLFTLIREIHDNPTDWSFPQSYIVLDGKAISAIMKSYEFKQKLSSVTTKCHSIIACRLSPVQKSQLVTMIKEANTSNITCAIGDGGNDVSMIQEAHVGLGLIGREGSAASQSADFAITRFHHIQRLLLVHGHWYYTRQSFLVQYSFYKNVALFLCQLFFAFFSNFSGVSLYDSVFLLMFNTLYTLLPVIVYGLTEQKYSGEALLAQPGLYKNNRMNKLMNSKAFAQWLALGLWHSVCIYFPLAMIWSAFETIYPEGHGLPSLGSAVAGAGVAVVNLKVLLESKYWSWVLVLATVFSIFSYVTVTVIFNVIPLFPDAVLESNFDQFYAYLELYNETIVSYLAVNVLVIFAALLPDCLIIICGDIKQNLRHAKKVIPN